jgi:hypothetical protein
MITVHPDGVLTLRFFGDVHPEHVEDGWQAEIALPDSLPHDIFSDRMVGYPADIALGERHYAGHVREFHQLAATVVVAGSGPVPSTRSGC